MHRQRNTRSETHANLFAEIIPALRGLAVDFGNSVTRLNACSERRRILRDKTNNKIVGGRFLDTHHVKDHQQDKRKHDVDERARKGNRRTSANRLRHKIAFIGNLAVLERIGIFTRHGHVAAERNRRNAVFRFAAAVTNQFLAETDTECIYLDVVPLRD